MAVRVEARGGWLAYRIYFDGREGRESTGLQDTPENRKRLGKLAHKMSTQMANGKFAYLDWFADGNWAHHYRPPAPGAVETPAAVETPSLPTITVREYATETWLPRSQPPAERKTLLATREKHLRHILPVFGDLGLAAVTRRLLLDFRSQLTRPKKANGKGLAMKTARDIIDSTFRALYRDARRDELVSGDPFADLDWPRKITPPPDPFTAAERDALLAFFWTRAPGYAPFVYVLFFTGLRIGEAVGLRWGAVDLRQNRMHVRISRTLGEDNPPKTAKAERDCTLDDHVVAVLRAIYPTHAGRQTFVFTTGAGNPIEAERFAEKHWRRALRATSIRHRKFMATRHTFLSLMANTSGVNLKWLADYAGTSVAMLEKHYVKTDRTMDAAQLALLAPPPRRRPGRVA